MPGLGHIGRMLIVVGAVVMAAGAALTLAGKMGWTGRLPGDIVVQRKDFTFYFPVATSVVISVVISLVLWLLGRK